MDNFYLILILIILIIAFLYLIRTTPIEELLEDKDKVQENKDKVQENKDKVQEYQVNTWKKPTGFILILISIGVFIYSLIRLDSLESRYRQGIEDFIGYSDEQDILTFLIVGSIIGFIIGIVLMSLKSETIVSQALTPIKEEQDM